MPLTTLESELIAVNTIRAASGFPPLTMEELKVRRVQFTEHIPRRQAPWPDFAGNPVCNAMLGRDADCVDTQCYACKGWLTRAEQDTDALCALSEGECRSDEARHALNSALLAANKVIQ